MMQSFYIKRFLVNITQTKNNDNIVYLIALQSPQATIRSAPPSESPRVHMLEWLHRHLKQSAYHRMRSNKPYEN